jgi:L-ascorbate metabolism protein UlaG (beta-lactamase superfamily)
MTQPVTVSITPDFFTDTTRSRLTWLGMAGAAINTRGFVVLIDPLLGVIEQDGQTVSEAGFALDYPLPLTAREVIRADLVCYTHADHDHIGQRTAELLAERTQCQFLAPPPVVRILTSLGIPAERIQTVRDDDRLTFGPLEITVTPALHDWQEEDPWQRGDCCGYLLRTPDGSVWHPGDSRPIDELFRYQNVDVLFYDVADIETHLGPYGSARIAASCGARVLIPYHYWTFGQSPGPFADFDRQQLTASAAGLTAKLVNLAPGELLGLPV